MKLKSVKILTPLNLSPVDDTLFKLGTDYRVDFITDEGTWRLYNRKEWLTDLRSGSDIINGIAPKWGNPIYTAGVLMHDTAFSGYISFRLANNLLAQCMFLSGEIGTCRAWMVKTALNTFGESHYCDLEMPLPTPYENNRKYESLTLVDK